MLVEEVDSLVLVDCDVDDVEMLSEVLVLEVEVVTLTVVEVEVELEVELVVPSTCSNRQKAISPLS